MTSHIKQLPWWKWTLLLIGAIVLASIGYADMPNHHPC